MIYILYPYLMDYTIVAGGVGCAAVIVLAFIGMCQGG